MLQDQTSLELIKGTHAPVEKQSLSARTPRFEEGVLHLQLGDPTQMATTTHNNQLLLMLSGVLRIRCARRTHPSIS